MYVLSYCTKERSLLFILVAREERRGGEGTPLLAAEETGIWGFHAELKLPQLIIETPADNELKLSHN